MGCGHSKINIYPRKNKKANNKKSVLSEKAELEEEEVGNGIENEPSETSEDCDQRKTIKVKPFTGPILTQTETSSSQQDFFKMLDEKIRNGPDYNSDSETEKAQEMARLNSLLRDWETASAGSRSLPVTPKRRPKVTGDKMRPDAGRTDLLRDPNTRPIPAPIDRVPYIPTQISQSIIHQTYGVSQPGAVAYRPPINYVGYMEQDQHHHISSSYSSAMQYQAISPYPVQPQYPAVAARKYPPSYNQHGSPIKMFPSAQQRSSTAPALEPHSSPVHKMYTNVAPGYVHNYGPLVQQAYQQQHSYSAHQPQLTYAGGGVPPNYYVSSFGEKATYSSQIATVPKVANVNGDLVQERQHQFYQQQTAHQQQYNRQYKDKDTSLTQQQQGYRLAKNYQSSVTIPIVVQNQPGELNSVHRKPFELT